MALELSAKLALLPDKTLKLLADIVKSSAPAISNLMVSSSELSSTWIVVSPSASNNLVAVVILVLVAVIASTATPLGGAVEKVKVVPLIL